jgi:hypothetical protein
MKWQGLNLHINDLNRWRAARANKNLDVHVLDKAVEVATEHLSCLGYVRDGNSARGIYPYMSVGLMESVLRALISARGRGVPESAITAAERLLSEAIRVNEFASSHRLPASADKPTIDELSAAGLLDNYGSVQ